MPHGRAVLARVMPRRYRLHSRLTHDSCVGGHESDAVAGTQ